MDEEGGEDAAAQHYPFISRAEEDVVCWNRDGGRVAGFGWDDGGGGLGLGLRFGGERWRGQNRGVRVADGVVEGGGVQEGGVEEVGRLSSGFQCVGSEGQGGGGGQEGEKRVFWVGHGGLSGWKWAGGPQGGGMKLNARDVNADTRYNNGLMNTMVGRWLGGDGGRDEVIRARD